MHNALFSGNYLIISKKCTVSITSKIKVLVRLNKSHA